MKNARGSSILMVILLTAVATIAFTTVWQSSMFTLDVALQRLAYEQRYHATCGILNYGIAVCKNRFDELSKHEITMSVQPWPADMLQECSGHLIMKPTSDGVVVQGKLQENNTVVCALSCRVHELPINNNPDMKTLAISEWRHETT